MTGGDKPRREAKAVKALIAKHEKQAKPDRFAGGPVVPTASLWSRIRRRSRQ